MKTLRKLSRTLLAVSGLLLAQPLMAQVPSTPGGEVPAPLVQVENPFEIGTGVQQVAPSVEATLAEFAATTRNRINQVLRDTATESEANAYTALIEAAHGIVQASNRTHRGRELLTRILINQALELTSGTPDASGVVPPARTGLLTRLQSPSLDTLPLAIVVLRKSFELAKDYAERDLAAATALASNASSPSAPLQLPYAEAAAARLSAARVWNRIATTKGPELEYQFLRISIQQWRNIVTQPNHQEVTSLATQIARLDTGVSRAAARLTTNPPTPTQFAEAARVLRGFLREVQVELGSSFGQTTENFQASGLSGVCPNPYPMVMTEIGATGVSATEPILRCHANCPHFSANSRDICIMTQQEAASSCRHMSNDFRLPTALEVATLMNSSGINPDISDNTTANIDNVYSEWGRREFGYTSSTYNPENIQGAPAAGIMTLQTLRDHFFWTDSLNTTREFAYTLNGATGEIRRALRHDQRSAWCMTERPRSAIRFNGLY